MNYERTGTLRQGRERYFAAYGFSEAAYAARFFKINLGPIPFYLPNYKDRARTVPLHDLHHVLTGYDANLLGEAEIGAWELASGCKDRITAWVFNALAVALGTVLGPRRVLRAFARGLRDRNLYREQITETLLDSPLEEVRRRLGIETDPI